jgi:excisionase family DNA binding protein
MKADVQLTQDNLLVPDLTCKQAQVALQVSHSTVWRLINKGLLNYYKVGNSIRISRRSIENLKNGGEV